MFVDVKKDKDQTNKLWAKKSKINQNIEFVISKVHKFVLDEIYTNAN